MTLLFLMTFADSRLFTLDRLSTFYSRSTLNFLLSIDSRLFTLDFLLSTLDFYSRLSTFTLDSRLLLSTLDLYSRPQKRTLRGRYSNSLVIDAGSQFSLRACSQASNWIELLLTRKRVYTQMTYFTEGCISLAGVQAHETQKIPSLGPGKSNWILRLFYGSSKPANDCDLSAIQIFILYISLLRTPQATLWGPIIGQNLPKVLFINFIFNKFALQTTSKHEEILIFRTISYTSYFDRAQQKPHYLETAPQLLILPHRHLIPPSNTPFSPHSRLQDTFFVERGQNNSYMKLYEISKFLRVLQCKFIEYEVNKEYFW